MDALLRRLTRTGLRRGLTGEHWAWLLLAGAAFLFRRVRAEEDHATTLELAPGERYLVRLVDAGTRGRGHRGVRRDVRRGVEEAGPLGENVTAALEAEGRGGGGTGAGLEASVVPDRPPSPAH